MRVRPEFNPSWLTVFLVALLLSTGIWLVTTRSSRSSDATTPPPRGVWAGRIHDLPSGRAVECVIARDPSGSVAVTCDWGNAVVRGRP